MQNHCVQELSFRDDPPYLQVGVPFTFVGNSYWVPTRIIIIDDKSHAA